MTFNRLRCFLLIVTCFLLAGCDFLEPTDSTVPSVTVNFVSADPPNGSTIKPDETITVTFDDVPGSVAVNQGTVGIADRTATISGPFPAGPLSLNITWAGGVQRLTYTVDDPTPEGMVSIPAGEFQMGSNDYRDFPQEQPVHTVYIDAFFMDETEVTNLEYKKFVLANPNWGKNLIDESYLQLWTIGNNDYPSGKASHPVVSVTWYAAMAYAQWKGKRLPTEAEWEYAARGGLVGKEYPWGDGIDSSKANYGYNVGDTTPVGEYPPNRYGLHDMAGNVLEWCLDEYDGGFYARSPRDNPLHGAPSVDWLVRNFTGVTSYLDRVLRGGGWIYSPIDLRVAARRTRYFAAWSDIFIGFRCARSQ